jgi:amidophosphoribosyltransferase
MNPEYYPKHECGVFGIFGHPDAAELTYFGLYALQHRGQESAGIVTAKEPGTKFKVHKGMGLVSQVFPESVLKDIVGTRAVGHVRYSTTGSSNLANAQPLVVTSSRGQLAIGHNGNLVNAHILRDELEESGSIFQTTTDSEIIVHLMAQPHGRTRENALVHALSRIQGAFSLVIMGENEIIGARDAFGFRPLSIGKLKDAYVLSSETCALDLIGAEFIRDVEPGEIVVIDQDGLRSIKPYVELNRKALCVFEFVYFARPDSNLNGLNVSKARVRMGRELARLYPVEADLVVPVPDSGNYAALGYAEASGIPYSHAFVRNHYIGRTFLQPSQLIRDFSVRVKLALLKEEVRGKRVVVVDDSIVRGTTARTRVINLREAGAREVHIRVSCPPHLFPCHYGIDFPDRKDLIANQMTREEIRSYLGADSLGYLDVAGMVHACGMKANEFCLACFTGDYPVRFNHEIDKLVMEKRKTQLTPLVNPGETQQEKLFS